MLDFIGYIILGVVFAAQIGPVSINAIQKGLKGGFIAAFSAYMGATLVDALYLILVSFGMSQFIGNLTFRIVIGICGSTVMIFFGIQNIRKYYVKQIRHIRFAIDKSKNYFVNGILFNISNPMAIMDWLVFYGAIFSSLSIGINNFILSLNIGSIIFGLVIWGIFISFITYIGKNFLNENAMRYVSLVDGIILLGFGLYFGYNAINLIIK